MDLRSKRKNKRWSVLIKTVVWAFNAFDSNYRQPNNWTNDKII
jgi:hypothetical protein